MALGLGLGLGIGNSITGSVLDPATSAFITATGITDATIINAVNRLVLNYKGQGNLNSSLDLWTNSLAIYPIVGGSASSHMYNLKDPRNLDAAFRLAFSGGWTHDSNGMIGNGINTFINTFIQANTNLTAASGRIGIYSRSNVNEFRYDMGATTAGGTELMIISRGSNTFYSNYGLNSSYGTITNTDSRGLFVTNRNGAVNTTGYKNGNLVITHSETGSLPNFNIYIGALNNFGTAVNYATKNYSFAVIGNGLSDANSLLEFQIIQQFQTDLGRAV